MEINKTTLPLGGAAQDDNFRDDGRLDPAVDTRLRSPEIYSWAIVAGVSALLLFLTLLGLRWIFCMNVNEYTPMTFGCGAANTVFWFYVMAMPIAAIATPVVLLWGRIQRTKVESYRARITRGRYNEPVDALAVINKTPQEAWAEFQLLTRESIQAAPYRQLYGLPQGLDAFNTTSNQVAPAANTAPPLPDAGPLVEAMPPDEWLALLNDPDGEPHILLAGKTKAGKSTLAETLMALRVDRGDDIFIIDPHYQPVNKYGETTWCGLKGVGGDSTEALRAALKAVRDEYERRKKLANEGQMPVGGFKPLTVVIDEALEIRDTLEKEWEAFQSVMGSGARKYNIFLILMSQSHLVKDMGGSTAKRENFVTVALNEKAKLLVLSEVTDPKERAAMVAELRGKPWTAAMSYRNEVHLLDRAGTREMRPQSLVGVASVWSAPPENSQNLALPDQTDERWSYYLEVAASLVTRDTGAKIIRAKFGGFDNNMWRDARRELGLSE